MPNLISVTDVGPNIIKPIQEAVSPYVGDVRKAGAIFKGNPALAGVLDLVFPEPMADGTLNSAIKRGDYRP